MSTVFRSRTNRQKFETELVSVWRLFSSPLELSLPLGGLPAEPVVWPSHNNGPVYGGCCGGGGAVTSPSPASCSRFLSALAPFSPLFILSPFIYLPLFRHVRPLGPSAEEPTPQNYSLSQMSDCAFVRPAVRWLEGCGRGMKPVRMRSSTHFVEGYCLHCLLCCRLTISLLGDIHNSSLIGMLNGNSITSHDSNCP